LYCDGFIRVGNKHLRLSIHAHTHDHTHHH
jgi:hypothetical protein